ncbi:hypothetical protein CCP2SC5_2820001 [Azospirillaceae bacterium]
MREGIRRCGLKTQFISYQTSTFAPTYLSFYPSRAEISSGRIPDRLWTIGSAYVELFRAQGVPEDRLLMVGSFRYHHFIETRDAPLRSSRGARQDLVVLCATSIDYQEALELVFKAAAAVQGKTGVRLLVNFHPVTSRMFRMRVQETVISLLGREPDGVEYAEAGVQDLLARADIVLYSASGSVFEAMAMGVPAIYVGRDWAIDQDKAPNAVAIRCRTISELRMLIDDVPLKQRPQDILRHLEAPAFDVTASPI